MMTLSCLLDESNELVVLGDEVGLSVDFDDDADLALAGSTPRRPCPQQQYGLPSLQR